MDPLLGTNSPFFIADNSNGNGNDNNGIVSSSVTPTESLNIPSAEVGKDKATNVGEPNDTFVKSSTKDALHDPHTTDDESFKTADSINAGDDTEISSTERHTFFKLINRDTNRNEEDELTDKEQRNLYFDSETPKATRFTYSKYDNITPIPNKFQRNGDRSPVKKTQTLDMEGLGIRLSKVATLGGKSKIDNVLDGGNVPSPHYQQHQGGNPTSQMKAIRASLIIQNRNNNSNNRPSRDIRVPPGEVTSPATSPINPQYQDNLDETFDFEDTMNTVGLTAENPRDKRFADVSDDEQRIIDVYSSKKLNTPIETAKKAEREVPEEEEEEDLTNYAYLFIIAVHSFDSSRLENQEDINICLSFNRDDVAFVHNVDASGWGEVTLIKNQMRGWVPFNYFSDIIKSGQFSSLKTENPLEYWRELIKSNTPLEKLLVSCGRFLSNPADYPLTEEVMTFNLDYINAIRDGIKELLVKTEAVSRSNEIVQNFQDVRKARKRLLADWYNLMIKADHYKFTTSTENIAKIMSLTYRVLKKAFTFYQIWSVEKINMEGKKLVGGNFSSGFQSPSTRHYKSGNITYLDGPPHAVDRLNEIHGYLFNYIGLILGRLDIVEHNKVGCELLEVIVHQIIMLLREMLYICKYSSSIVQKKYNYAYDSVIDKNVDPLLALVSELVSCIKVLVSQTIEGAVRSDADHEANSRPESFVIDDHIYHYTAEGQRLIKIVSDMTVLISNTLGATYNYLRLIGNFKLNPGRQYIDFAKIKLSPEVFVKKCSEGLMMTIGRDKLRQSVINMDNEGSLQKYEKYNGVARYSSIRAGSPTKNFSRTFSPVGTLFLNDIMDSPGIFSNDPEISRHMIDESHEEATAKWLGPNGKSGDESIPMREVMLDREGNMIGASFRALIYRLTDEQDKPSSLLIATVLLNYRKFAKPLDLVNELINRFAAKQSESLDQTAKMNNTYFLSTQLKSRRKLIGNIFREWMESYWDHYSDYKLLPTMINFFNETASEYLPIQSRQLIVLAAKLFSQIPRKRSGTSGKKVGWSSADTEDFEHWTDNRTSSTIRQLISKSLAASRTASMFSDVASAVTAATNVSLTLDERLIDEYELTTIANPDRPAIRSPSHTLNLGTSTFVTGENIAILQKFLLKYYSAIEANGLGDYKSSVKVKDLGAIISNWKKLLNKSSVPISIMEKTLSEVDLVLVDLNPLEVAKQLTLIESRLFVSVEPFELINQKYINLCPNIGLMVTFTNQLSNYVIETLVTPKIRIEERVKRLMSWLRIALSTLYFRNFNSLVSIMTAVQNHAVSRLKPMWSVLSKKYVKLFQYLARISNPSHNYKVYRGKLRKVAGGSQSGRSALPVVPFFNLFLQDLTFIDEGNPDYRAMDTSENLKVINVDKYFRITKTIKAMQELQINYESSDKFGMSPKVDQERRDLFFQPNDQLSIDTYCISSIPELQQFILLELWRVGVYYEQDNDRAYQLSLLSLPKQ